MRGGPGGAGSGGSNPWDSDLVAGVAFHPRKCSPSSKTDAAAGGWIDSDISAADGAKLAYRLYISPDAPRGAVATPICALVYFHANAELCTDLREDRRSIHDCGFQVILCPEFRGYAWSSGKPQLGSLCPDADAFMEAMPGILQAAGVQASAVRAVVHGRSLGSACAVHVAARASRASAREEGPAEPVVQVAALVVESGVMSVLDLPMVQQLGAMMPQILRLLASVPCPLSTLGEMREVTIPTLVMHGDRDDISPVEQAVEGHSACASEHKKLVRFRSCHHNDIRAAVPQEYYSELLTIAEVASGEKEPEVLLQEAPSTGILGAIFGALRCLPKRR